MKRRPSLLNTVVPLLSWHWALIYFQKGLLSFSVRLSSMPWGCFSICLEFPQCCNLYAILALLYNRWFFPAHRLFTFYNMKYGNIFLNGCNTACNPWDIEPKWADFAWYMVLNDLINLYFYLFMGRGALPMLRSLWCAAQMGHFGGPQSMGTLLA